MGYDFIGEMFRAMKNDRIAHDVVFLCLYGKEESYEYICR